MNLIDKALGFAYKSHVNQFRKDEVTPYIVHPIEVMRFLQNECGINDDELLAAALLHDVVEDCTVSNSIISENFNDRITNIVAELTFIGGNKQQYLESFKDKSDDALLIKCADRLCNVKDFIYVGETTYAYKYLRKADYLFITIKNRINIKVDIKLAIIKEYERLRLY